MRKHPLTHYGKEIKMKLIKVEKSQEWLIGEVNKKSKFELTAPYLNRIMTGKVVNSSVIPIINEILGIK